MASTNFNHASGGSYGHSNLLMAPQSASRIGHSISTRSQRSQSPYSVDRFQSLHGANAIAAPPSPANSESGIALRSNKQVQAMKVNTPAGCRPYVYQSSLVAGLTGKHSKPTTPETTPPPSSYEFMLEEPEDFELANSPGSAFRVDEPQHNHERSKKVHGMEEISRIVWHHLSRENSYDDGEQYLEDGPKRKRQKRDHNPRTPSDGFPQNDDETRKHRAIFNVHWQVKEFVAGQFGDLRAVSLGSVIVVTGSARDAQATTVREYLLRTWPDTGLVLLELIQEMLHEGRDISRGKSKIDAP